MADALSRLPKEDTSVLDTLENFYTILDCYGTNTPNYDFHPLPYARLAAAQHTDPEIKKVLKKDNSKYHIKDFHGGGKTRSLVCYEGKIVVPTKLQQHIINWYHTVLYHPGINRTEESIAQHLFWPKSRDQITRYVQTCSICQKNKRKMVKFGFGSHPKKQRLLLGINYALTS